MTAATIQRIAAAIILAAVSFAPQTASAATLPLTTGGAKVYIDFKNPQAGKVLLAGSVPSVPGLNLSGLIVNISLGGFTRNFMLDAHGQGSRTSDLFQMYDNGTSLIFVLNALDNNLLATLAPNVITDTNATNLAVSIDATIAFNSTTYTKTLNGFYDAMAGDKGLVFLGFINAPKSPFKPVVKITTLKARPNPAKVSETVTIKGNVNLTELKGPVTASINFGDMTAPIRRTGAELQAMLKAGVTHSYATAGVFVPRIVFMGSEEIAATRLYVLVGPGYDVNSTNGAYTHLQKMGGGAVALELGIGNVPGSSDAQTYITDIKGDPAGGLGGLTARAVGGPRAAPTSGTNINAMFTSPGIYFTETNIVDGSSNAIGKIRKTILIGASDFGSPATARDANDPPEVAPRDSGDESDEPIVFTSMSGSFKFTSSKLDKVVFRGMVGLPAGYTPKDVNGNDIQMAMGNVGDTVHLDSKGKLSVPTTTGVITRFHLTPPKLTNGVAVGGEMARVTITMSIGDLDLQGFDSEGVTVNVRSDEEGQASVARFIQVDMLISGKTYSALVPVDYSVSSGSDFGTFSGRSSN